MTRGQWKKSEIAYCSNVHPGHTAEEIEANISFYARAVQTECRLDRLDAGLWIPKNAADQYTMDPAAFARFQGVLDENGVQLVTINGFPFGDFHEDVVKQRVFAPDWATASRLDYTLKLAQILGASLPSGNAGSISTVPLGHAASWDADRHAAALNNLCELTVKLARVYDNTKKEICVCLEMEPGCVLETSAQAIRFFTDDLRDAAERRGVPADLVRRHIGICFDVCHQAVMFEDVGQSLQQFHDASIRIGKIQLSSALHIPRPSAVLELLQEYAEPRYLHQVRTRTKGLQVMGSPDLGCALTDAHFPRDSAWRIHFHAPLHIRALMPGLVETTQASVAATLDHLRDYSGYRPHLEVETYTLPVLPDSLRPKNEREFVDYIARDMLWVYAEMGARGLLDEI
jgi:sugar phosphate isomerase/epimerase